MHRQYGNAQAPCQYDIVIVPSARADAVLVASHARDEKERAARMRAETSDLRLGLYGMRDTSARKGLIHKPCAGG